MTENQRFTLILDYDDEIGIKDNFTGDVIVEKVPQNQNTVGFCQGIVGLLNNFAMTHVALKRDMVKMETKALEIIAFYLELSDKSEGIVLGNAYKFKAGGVIELLQCTGKEDLLNNILESREE